MKAVLQRVSRASVRVGGDTVGAIGRGYLVLLGVVRDDVEADADWLADKIAGVRVWPDADGKMSLDLTQVEGGVLAVSQFTLAGSLRRGRRPSFEAAARPEIARPLYERFVVRLRERGIPTETGRFQAMMEVDLVNEGPVTLLLDSRERGRR